MTEVTKGDLMFFQNEILGDMKKLDIKINNKLDSSIEELKTKINESHNQRREDLPRALALCYLVFSFLNEPAILCPNFCRRTLSN